MNKTFLRFAPALVLLLAGCGGGGGNHDDGGSSEFSSNLTLTTDQDYNGSTKDLSGTPTVSFVLNLAAIRLTNGSRTFQFTAPPSTIQAGATLTVGQNSVVSVYQEDDGSTDRTWQATAGTVTITRLSGNTLDATVSGVTYVPSTVISNSTAKGGFSVSGTIKNAPLPVESQ